MASGSGSTKRKATVTKPKRRVARKVSEHSLPSAGKLSDGLNSEDNTGTGTIAGDHGLEATDTEDDSYNTLKVMADYDHGVRS